MSLYAPSLYYPKLRDYGARVLSRYLSLAKHNVEKLIYWNDSQNGCYYTPTDSKDSYHAVRNCLPILEFKTLIKLTLRGCYLATENKVDVSIDLPNLKQLRLIDLNTDENMLETLLAKCRALKKLILSCCEGFKVLRVPRHSQLKVLVVRNIYDLDLVKINATTLQCLTLYNVNSRRWKVKMASNSCNLVKLFVTDCGITDGFFSNVAEFPHLETVFLSKCQKLKHIKITGKSLRLLVIEECPNLSQTELHTPKQPTVAGNFSRSKNNIKWRLFKC